MSIRMDSSRTYLTQREESCWSKRSTIEKQLCVCICVLAVITFGLIVTVCLLSQSKTPDQPNKDVNGTSCLTEDCVLAASRFLKNINKTVHPCDDFYSFNCDGWKQHNRLPDDSGVTNIFDVLDTEVSYDYKDLLSAPVSPDDPEAVKKSKIMYKACLDEDAVFNSTYDQVIEILTEMGKWPLITPNWTEENFDWVKVEAEMQRNPASPSSLSGVISFGVTFAYTYNTSEKMIELLQTSTVLGRDYLLNPDKYKSQIASYKNLIVEVAKNLGNQTEITDVEKQVDELVEFESNIANISTSSEEFRQITEYYNVTIANLTAQTKELVPWLRLCQLLFENITEINDTELVILNDYKYLLHIGDLLKVTPMRTLANYMLWKFLKPLLKIMSPEIQQLSYEYTMSMTGSTKSSDRWWQCTSDIDNSLGMALGRQFIQSKFSEDSKNKATELIKHVQNEFVKILHGLDWMDETTKSAAIDKALAITHQVGYPDWILNNTKLDKHYEDVDISPTDYFQNLNSAARSSTLRSFKSLRKRPVDKNEWDMTPGTVNAYYSSQLNSINFPAGILQAPFYYANALMALNAGGIASVVGHEITHGFDDDGKNYNKYGVRTNWWSSESAKNFERKAECFVEEYSKFCPSILNDTCVKGNQTLGENIADNGGLKTALKVYRTWVNKHGQELRLPGLEEFSTDQIFFMSFAQLWCENSRTESLLSSILSDSHSPGRYRVLGTIENMDDFKQAFHCESKNEKKCELW